MPDDLVARLEGKSSRGRLGLLIHSTAGFSTPVGRPRHARALERRETADTIYPGMKIGQLSFVQLSEPAERPYGSEGIGSKYQGQGARHEPLLSELHRTDGLRRQGREAE